MNAYFCDAGEQHVSVDRVPYGETTADVPSVERVCNLVFAETRGQAKMLFINHYRKGLQHNDVEVSLEYTDQISIRLVAKNIEQNAPEKAGIAPHDHPLWELASWRRFI